MLSNNISDENIMNLLEEVQLSYLLEREGGLDSVKYWNEELSQGEKFRIIICRQKIAMARLFYHKPDYAILDECTSNTSLDMESLL
jgi:ABC-type uncharacterized transport system fused permease/ATPase subunit